MGCLFFVGAYYPDFTVWFHKLHSWWSEVSKLNIRSQILNKIKASYTMVHSNSTLHNTASHAQSATNWNWKTLTRAGKAVSLKPPLASAVVATICVSAHCIIATVVGSSQALINICQDYWYYISITIVQSYTGKYHEFVAICIVTSAQTATNEWYFFRYSLVLWW